MDKNCKGPNQWTPLHLSVEKGHTKITNLVLDNVNDKNPATEGGWTPLHQAARYGFSEIFKIIISKLSNNKNPESHQDSTTPLHLAARYDNLSRDLVRHFNLRMHNICDKGSLYN